jgi:hypothetical protein
MWNSLGGWGVDVPLGGSGSVLAAGDEHGTRIRMSECDR